MKLIDDLRKPEYTGENRCTPCTVLNVGITTAISLLLATVNAGLAVAAAVAMLMAIYLRGYLIPGTPTITKRYFPEWILRYFDHAETRVEPDSSIDPEELLLRAGAVEEVADGLDLQLEPTFEEEWFTRYRDVQERAIDRELLASLLDVDPDRLAIEWHGQAFVAWLDDQWIGQWESRVAFLADIAADNIMPDYLPEWNELSLGQRSNALGVLRLFIERCPACDGNVVMEKEIKQSCCREVDVIATICLGCGERLFEAEYDPRGMAELEADVPVPSEAQA